MIALLRRWADWLGAAALIAGAVVFGWLRLKAGIVAEERARRAAADAAAARDMHRRMNDAEAGADPDAARRWLRERAARRADD